MIIFPRIFAVARYRLNHTLQDNVSFLTTEREEGEGVGEGKRDVKFTTHWICS